LAVGLSALAPTAASAGFRDATVYVHSAKSGELGAGRLTLRGVGRRVSWFTHRGRFGVLSIKRLHRGLFSPGTRAITGMLQVTDRRGGGGLALGLSRPRYNATRRTVSYRARRLNKRRLPSLPPARAAAGFQTRRFGAASLSIVAAPPVMSGDWGNDCNTSFQNNTNSGLGVEAVSS
jgi:hypothetical protein